MPRLEKRGDHYYLDGSQVRYRSVFEVWGRDERWHRVRWSWSGSPAEAPWVLVSWSPEEGWRRPHKLQADTELRWPQVTP